MAEISVVGVRQGGKGGGGGGGRGGKYAFCKRPLAVTLSHQREDDVTEADHDVTTREVLR